MITIIAAVALNNVIGTATGKLPWKVPEEMKFFKQQTIGNSVVMGKNTWLSIGKPLVNRENIVLSSTLQKKDLPPEVMLYNDFNVLCAAMKSSGKHYFIIGGAHIYQAFLPISNRLLITHLPFSAEGNVFFPEIPLSLYSVTNYLLHELFIVKEYLRISQDV